MYESKLIDRKTEELIGRAYTYFTAGFTSYIC